MIYKVIDTFPIGDNTSVTIEGNGEGLKNGSTILDATGDSYKLLSVAMVSNKIESDIGKTITILVQGLFDSDLVSF